MNHHIFNTQAKSLLMAGYAKSDPNGALLPIATDSIGRMILSPGLNLAVESSGLDIRPLDENRDNAAVTASNLAIRDLAGTRDSVTWLDQSSVFSSESSPVVLVPSFFLPTDLGAYRRNTFYVRNTSGISVGVEVTLQIAPANIDNLYTDDGSETSLFGGNVLTFQPSKLMRWARIRVRAILVLADITVYHFGQT